MQEMGTELEQSQSWVSNGALTKIQMPSQRFGHAKFVHEAPLIADLDRSIRFIDVLPLKPAKTKQWATSFTPICATDFPWRPLFNDPSIQGQNHQENLWYSRQGNKDINLLVHF